MKNLAISFLLCCLLAAVPTFGAINQHDDNGSVNTTGNTVTIASGTGTIATIQIESLVLINDTTSANNILICLDKADISATCNFELQPGETFSVDDKDAARLTQFHFESDAGVANYRWLVTY